MKGNYFRRIGLFLATNLLVLVLISVIFQVLGLERTAWARDGGIDLQALLIYSAIIGFTGAFVSLLLSKMMAKMFTGAQVITQPSNDEEAWLVTTVDRLARQAGIQMPEVAIYDSPDPNAFATGARRNAALVAVSTGLLRLMRRDEVEGVLAHEISHAANGDMVTMTLLQGVMNTFVVFFSRLIGWVVDRVVLRNEKGRGIGFWVAAFVSEILLGILASLVVAWFSRQREYRADAGAAKLVGPEPMIRALERLKLAQDAPADLPASINSFGIRGGSSWLRLLMSHPPLEDRIAALRGGSPR